MTIVLVFNMNPEEFRNKSKSFGLRIIRLVEALPKTRTGDVISKQLLRSGTSVGANYRAACRAKSPADFIAKMKIVEEECDETIYWIEMLTDSGQIGQRLVIKLLKEADEILAMVVASIKTVRNRQ